MSLSLRFAYARVRRAVVAFSARRSPMAARRIGRRSWESIMGKCERTTDEAIGRPQPWDERRYLKPGQAAGDSVHTPPGTVPNADERPSFQSPERTMSCLGQRRQRKRKIQSLRAVMPANQENRGLWSMQLNRRRPRLLPLPRTAAGCLSPAMRRALCHH